MNKEAVTAYILCGGKSKRFGSDKALFEIDGIPIIEIIIKKLKKTFNRVILAAEKPEKYSFTRLECIADIYKECGPLGGIHAALNNSKTGRIFIVTCDMPFIDEKIMQYLTEYETDKKIVIPKSGGKNHHLFGIYAKSLLPAAEELLERTKDLGKCASPYDLISISGCEIIDFDLLPQFNNNSFFNLNAPEDLRKRRNEIQI